MISSRWQEDATSLYENTFVDPLCPLVRILLYKSNKDMINMDFIDQ